jgi:hypothetical protein
MDCPVLPDQENTPLVLDWADICQTTEYQVDFNNVQTLVFNSLGNDTMAQSASAFIYIIANLVAIQRYYIRHISETADDLDLSPFINLIAAEVGLDLPITSAIPLNVFLRENKSWAGHKTTVKLINFIGLLCGSQIQVEYPKDLIFRWGTPRSMFSGAKSPGGGPLPWDQTCLAHWRDGIYWAQFVYVLQVLQAQNVVNITDLINMVKSVHPLGLQRFMNFDLQLITPVTEPATIPIWNDWAHDYYTNINPGGWPAWSSSGWSWSTRKPSVYWSMHSLGYLFQFRVTPVPLLKIDTMARRYSTDTLTHQYYLDNPAIGFSRGIGQPDGTYETVYSRTDAIVYQNVTQNVGIGSLPYSVMNSLTLIELENAALNNQGNLDAQGSYPHETWMYDELLTNITST